MLTLLIFFNYMFNYYTIKLSTRFPWILSTYFLMTKKKSYEILKNLSTVNLLSITPSATLVSFSLDGKKTKNLASCFLTWKLCCLNSWTIDFKAFTILNMLNLPAILSISCNETGTTSVKNRNNEKKNLSNGGFVTIAFAQRKVEYRPPLNRKGVACKRFLRIFYCPLLSWWPQALIQSLVKLCYLLPAWVRIRFIVWIQIRFRNRS